MEFKVHPNNMPPMIKSSLKQHGKKIAVLGFSAGIIASSLAIEAINFPKKAVANSSMMEFRWDQSRQYKKLYYWQSSKDKRERSTYYFVMRPKDRKTAILKLKLSFPKYFDAKLKAKKFTLCRVELGGMLDKTRCKEKIPTIFEIAKDQSYVEAFPKQIIPADEQSYAVVMKIFNPHQAGMFQINGIAQTPGDVPISTYIGSWTVDID